MRVEALVVFTDQRQVRGLNWLRPGFRHCFVVVRDPAGEWLACDWILGRLVFHVYGPQTTGALVDRFTADGHRVVVAERRRPDRQRPWLRPMTCVEVVKQAIGLAGLRPLTPYGLCRRLVVDGCPLFGESVNRKKNLDHAGHVRYPRLG